MFTGGEPIMISNITIGGGFKGALRYAYEKESAKPLYRNGVFGKDAGAIAGEMRAVADQKNIKNPVFHISLSLDNEHGSDEQWKLASEAYLTKMGFDLEKSQYTVTRHKDTKHDHCHIIANRVMLDGRVVSDSNSFKRSHEATRSAEAAAGLNAFDKTAQQTLKGKLHGLKSHINDSLAQHKNYQAFKAEKSAKDMANIAQKHGLLAPTLQSFVDAIMRRMIFDGELLSDLLAPLELGWKARTQKELALMEDLMPLLKKLAQGREISGLAAYE